MYATLAVVLAVQLSQMYLGFLLYCIYLAEDLSGYLYP